MNTLQRLLGPFEPFQYTNRRLYNKSSILKVVAVSFVAMFFIALAKLPLMSQWSGDFADVTFAVANQDMPSGIYYDRDFDWPTGEAVWVDVPAWILHLALLCCAVGCVAASLYRKRTPNQPLQATAARAGQTDDL